MSKADQIRNAWHTQLLNLFHGFSAFGGTSDGGVSRLAVSEEDKQARDHLCDWFQSNDFSVRVDPVGNIFGILDFGEDYAPSYFFCGSHLDSQPNGGRFDGALGVACACVAGLYLKELIGTGELDPAYRFFVVVNWTGEEGARFQPSLIGSSVFCGTLALDDALKLKDADGMELEHALSQIGYLGTETMPVPERYLELHIEQGGLLEQSEAKLGLVEACWGTRKIRVQIAGRADHTGPTPMEDRRDAMLAAALLIVDVKAVSARSEIELLSSVGRLVVHPNSPNTVADVAELWIEFRSANEDALRDAERQLNACLTDVQEETGCKLRVSNTETRNVTEFDGDGISKAKDALSDKSLPYLNLNTISGHDAVRLQSICPSNLIFVPSKGGISHSPAEFTSDQDICDGFDGMAAVLTSLMTTSNPDPIMKGTER